MDIKWSDLGAIVGKAAPLLGTLLGGPAGGAVGSIIAAGLGVANTPDAVQQAIATNPDAAVKLAQIQSDNQIKLQELLVQAESNRLASDTQQLQISAGDRSNARQQTVDLVRAGSPIAYGAVSVSVLIVLGYFATVYMLFNRGQLNINDNLKDVMVFMLGALQIGFGQVCNYWLGSSAGSAKKDDTIKKITG